jgi:hypothetical protein
VEEGPCRNDRVRGSHEGEDVRWRWGRRPRREGKRGVGWGRDAGEARPRRGQLQRRAAEEVVGPLEVGSPTPQGGQAWRGVGSRRGRSPASARPAPTEGSRRRGRSVGGGVADPAGRVSVAWGGVATREKPGLGEASSNGGQPKRWSVRWRWGRRPRREGKRGVGWGRDAGEARPRRGQLQRRAVEEVVGPLEVGSPTPQGRGMVSSKPTNDPTRSAPHPRHLD